MKSKKKATKSMPKPDLRMSEFAAKELELAIGTFREQFSLLIQIATVLVIANVTVGGYAISEKIAGLLFFTALFPFSILFVSSGIRRYMLPIVYTAVAIEHKYGQDEIDWLASTFGKFVLSRQLQRFSVV